MAGEICEKCGREIPSYQQAYVFRGEIVCAECDRVSRSEQVPQPASSPEPCSKTRKGTKKDVSLRNRILAAIGIVIIAVVLWKMCFSGPKYQVEYWFEKDDKEIAAYQKTIKELEDAIEKSEPTGTLRVSWKGLYESQLQNARGNLESLQKREKWFLKVRIEGSAADLVVMVTGQEGGAVCQKRIYREDMMDNIQTAVFEIENENSEIRIGVIDEWSGSRLHIKPGDHSLVVKNFVSEKVIYKTSIKLPPEKVIEVGDISSQKQQTAAENVVPRNIPSPQSETGASDAIKAEDISKQQTVAENVVLKDIPKDIPSPKHSVIASLDGSQRLLLDGKSRLSMSWWLMEELNKNPKLKKALVDLAAGIYEQTGDSIFIIDWLQKGENLWAVGSSGQGGIVCHSPNNGETWTRQWQSTGIYEQSQAIGIYFSDSNEGWVLLLGGILHTTNGGSSWREIVGSENKGLNFSYLFILDKKRLAAWTGLFLYYTEDGGLSWKIFEKGEKEYGKILAELERTFGIKSIESPPYPHPRYGKIYANEENITNK